MGNRSNSVSKSAKLQWPKYMARERKPPSQTWRTFLNNHAKQLVSMDFFVVPTVSFRVLYRFRPVLRQFAAAKVEFKGCETDTPFGDVDCQCLPLDYLKVYHDASCGVFLTGPDRSERHHRATPLVALLFELVESALEILRAAGECNRFES